ncbi:MAG: sensor domain-containing diguanylate cyclase, partial [Candidatus Omnitrophica bacterium]|nr:sensor domain-containing diguanylate cyclase [Candidatus Omnitrophota bacterium]
ILEVHRCSLMLYDEEKKELFIAGSKGIPDEVAKSVRLVVGDPIAGTVAENREPLLVKNIEYEKGLKRANRPYYKSRSFMIVPIVFEDKLLGVINVTDKDSILGHEEIFSDVDLKILTAIAREVAVTLENFKIYKDLSTLTITDPLTNIYNYRQFAKSLEQEMKRADREKGDLCIFMMDIDKFKTYNDTFGHLEGDNLLREIGGIMKSQLRATDIVCRYAGDEFCIILPGADDKGAQMSADKIVKAVRAVKTFKRPVTISIGIAAYRSGMSQKDLIACADKALYQTKQNGRNGFSIHEE